MIDARCRTSGSEPYLRHFRFVYGRKITFFVRRAGGKAATPSKRDPLYL